MFDQLFDCALLIMPPGPKKVHPDRQIHRDPSDGQHSTHDGMFIMTVMEVCPWPAEFGLAR